MPRGRQYYDPIVQVPGKVEGSEDLSRIELYMAGDVRDEAGQGKWHGRRIDQGGLIVEVAPGDFSHDRALAQAEALWPGLTVYELREESEDSTWEGMGPSPRLWGGVVEAAAEIREILSPSEPAPTQPETLRAFTVSAGTYMLADDLLSLLESYAQVYDRDGNPSAALGLREAARAIAESTVETD